jgi:hypothetical protein
MVPYYILFFNDIASRSVHIAGITPHPDNRWMKQIARNVTDTEDGFLRDTQYLILGRDTNTPMSFVTSHGRLQNVKSVTVRNRKLPAPWINPL